MIQEQTFRDAAGRPVRLNVTSLVIAGWTGRDQAAVRAYVASLAEGGFTPPDDVPRYYRVSPRLLTTAGRIHPLGDATSGEVEVVLLTDGASLYVGLGSDHTDRQAARSSVARAKQLCEKPIAPQLWRFDDVAAHWDELELCAWEPGENGKEVIYQSGTLAELLPPDEIIAGIAGAGGQMAPGQVVFCGTPPVIGGIRPAGHFRMRLRDPRSGREITHEYWIDPLPVVQ